VDSKDEGSQPLAGIERAVNFAIYDRKRTWHARHAPIEEVDAETLVQDLFCPSHWVEIASSEVALRREVRAYNGRLYPLTFLPIRSFALRYAVVDRLSAHLNGFWHSRLDGKFLSCRSAHSHFLGKTDENTRHFRQWEHSQTARFVLKFDISNFFPSIRHQDLLGILESRLGGHPPSAIHEALDLLPHLLRYRYRCDGTDEVRTCEGGLPIGNTTERFFSNLYLSSLDDLLLERPEVASSRRLDDIRVYSNDRAVLLEILELLTGEAEKIGLSVNSKKTSILERR